MHKNAKSSALVARSISDVAALQILATEAHCEVVLMADSVPRKRLPAIHFEDDVAGAIETRLVVADRRRRDQPSVLQDGRDLDDGHIDVAKKPAPRLLPDVAEMDVEVIELARVESARAPPGLIGRAGAVPSRRPWRARRRVPVRSTRPSRDERDRRRRVHGPAACVPPAPAAPPWDAPHQ